MAETRKGFVLAFDDSPLRLKLSERQHSLIEAELCRRVEEGVRDASERDNNLLNWRNSIEGLGQSATQTRWRNACSLNDPIVGEAHLTTVSQLVQALHRDPKVAVESFYAEDDDSASEIEAFCVVEGHRADADNLFYMAATNASRDPAVPVYMGWQQKVRKTRETRYRKKGEAATVAEDEQEEGEDYEPVAAAEEVDEEGYDIRIVDLANFYLWPSNSPSIERATATVERFYVTEEELYAGIGENGTGYDEDAVMDLIAAGPGDLGAEGNEYKQTLDDQDGIRGAGEGSGLYELFLVFTKLPFLLHEDEPLPEHLRLDNFMCVLCPGRNICLKLEFSPYPGFVPYYAGGILPETNRFLGHCVPSLLEDLQAEANANLRFTIDSQNLTMAPAMKVRKSAAVELNKWSIFPGAQIPMDDPINDMVPVEWDRAPVRDGLATQQFIQGRAKALFSAEGQGELQTKVRKNAEVQAVETQANAKFGLYLWNFQRTIVAPFYEHLLRLKLLFGNVNDEDGEDFLYQGKKTTITAKALRGKYQFVPTATSLTASPETRQQNAEAVQKVQIEYIQAVTQLPPQFHKQLWHMARELLLDLGKRNAQSYIGEEPQGQPEQAPQQQIAPPQQPGGNGFYPQVGAPAFGSTTTAT